MPKKKVSKVKRGKAGKLKNEGRQESKANKGLDIEKAKVNAALWEVKLQLTDQSLLQYREACRKLAGANEELTNQLHRVEKDAIDMIGFFQNQDAEKEEKVNLLQESLRNQKALAREEQKRLVEDYTLQISEMKELFRMRSSDFNMIQDELKKIKEFQQKKAQMEQELIDMKNSMNSADKTHRENLNTMEYRFFKEKARLEKEAEQRIELVVEKAHKEAILKLDDASLSVFKENVRLREALKYHTKETEDLQKRTEALTEENASLALCKSTFDAMVKKNAAQVKFQNEELSNLKAKVATLEQDLELKVREFEREKEQNLVSAKASRAELERLQKAVADREKELGCIKGLVSSIAAQRSELEEFFLEALAQVKQEITSSRLRYRKEAQQAYRWRMREATAGKLEFPPIRTFHKNPHSTNSAYSDTEVAEVWTHGPGSKVEISDLTWEQKEQVLRLLFAKMNGQRARKASQRWALRASSEKNDLPVGDATGIKEEASPVIFITPAPESVLPSKPNRLPATHSI